MSHSITVQDIFNSTSNGVIATDSCGCIVLINQKAVRILGLKKNKAMGANVSDVLPLTSRHVIDCLKTGKSQIGCHIRGKINLFPCLPKFSAKFSGTSIPHSSSIATTAAAISSLLTS